MVSYEERIIGIIVATILYFVLNYIFKNNKKMKMTFLAILVITSFTITDYIMDKITENRLIKSVEMLDAHLNELYPSENWTIYHEKSKRPRETDRVVLIVHYEREDQIEYLYHIDGKKIKQVHFYWKYPLEKYPENYMPLFWETK